MKAIHLPASWSPANVIPQLVAAIAELNQELLQLEARVKALEAKPQEPKPVAPPKPEKKP